jgi:hypothetical protein
MPIKPLTHLRVLTLLKLLVFILFSIKKLFDLDQLLSNSRTEIEQKITI